MSWAGDDGYERLLVLLFCHRILMYHYHGHAPVLQSLAFYIWLKCDSCSVVSYQQPLRFCKNGPEREPLTPAIISLCRSKECQRVGTE